MSEKPRPDAHWRLVGGRPCLDFVNTVAGRVSSPGRAQTRPDYADHVTRNDLPDYESLLRWGAFASLLTPSEVRRLRDHARRSSPVARQVLRRALSLREALYRIGKALVEGWFAPSVDVRAVDREVREARQQQRLVVRDGRLEADWIAGSPRLDRVLWPVALSAAAVFGSEDTERLKQCGGVACGWLFVDTTRNHSRQWCEMADCGNLAKVHRFRERHGRPGPKRR